MVSILTLTYQRKSLLEEAIQSYLLQYERYKNDTEMVVINDSSEVEYVYNHPNIRIYNLKERFSSVGKKLEWGFTKCNGKWIYRLDDDDLLSPHALEVNEIYRTTHPTYDVLRCQKNYFYVNNQYDGLADSINNGNCYHRDYINRIGDFIDRSFGEDNWLTFHNEAKIHTGDLGRYTMIYRWGMGVYHISGMGDTPNEEVYRKVDLSNTESGIIQLKPGFNAPYWEQLPH